MSTSQLPPLPPSPGGLYPTPPISRGGARAAILSRLAAQGRSPDFLDEGAVGRLIDHAGGSPRTLRASVDATLALAAREGARRGDAALVGRALEAAVPRRIVTAKTRRALWLAGAGFAAASVLLIFVAPLHPARLALAPETVPQAAALPEPAPLAHVPEAHVAATPPKIAAPATPPLPAPPAASVPVEPAPAPAPSSAPAPPPSAVASPAETPPPAPVAGPATPAAPSPTAAPAETAAVPAPQRIGPVNAPPPAPPAQAGALPAPPPSQKPAVPPLAPDIGVAVLPVPAAPVPAEPPTALVLYEAGAPGVQQRLNSLSARLRQAGIGQVERRAVPAGTALGRPVSFFDRGDLALAQRAAGVLASEGWPNLPVDELAPRMIRPRAAWRQHHVVIELQLP